MSATPIRAVAAAVRVVNAPDDFVLNGEACPRFPIVVSSKLGVIIAIVDYLIERAVTKRVDAATVLRDAYCLAHWFAFLAEERVNWTRVSDEHLLAWRRSMDRQRIGRTEHDAEGHRQANRKLSIVCWFYYVHQTVLGTFPMRIIQDPFQAMTSPDIPIKVQVTAINKKGGFRLRPRVSYATVPSSGVGRPTPSAAEADLIHLRACDRPTIYAAASHHCIFRLERDAGFRAVGVSRLTCDALAQGLRVFGIGRMEGGVWRTHDLPGLADDAATQAAIRHALHDLKRDCKVPHVEVRVLDKNSRDRAIRLATDLVLDLLDFIWDQRAEFTRSRRVRHPAYAPPDEIVLSSKTGTAITPAGVGNAMKSAFNAAGVAGSGHRLRARWVEDALRALVLKYRSMSGRGKDDGTISLHLAQLAGWADPKSAASYLNRLTRMDDQVPSETVEIFDQEVGPVIRAFVEAVNRGDQAAKDMVDFMAAELGLAPPI